MLTALPVSLFIGIILGFLSGLGIGGGSLLILWLTLALNMDQTAARNINLLFFLPAAVVSCYYRKKQGHLQFKSVLPGILGGCAGAVLGSKIGSVLNTALLRKLFGILLLLSGFRELFYCRQKKTSQ